MINRFSIFLLIAMAVFLVPSHAQESFKGAHALETGSGGLDSVWGAEYDTLRSDLVIMRFDLSLESKARALFPKVHNYLLDLQQNLKFKLNRPFPMFLVSRAFGNAFVAYPDVASSSFSVMPIRLAAVELSSVDFLLAGDAEDFFDTFAHEIMHYVEVEQRTEIWSSIFGDAAFRRADPTAWMAEAWAVVHEAQGATFKGRAKSSFFGALMRSGVSQRSVPQPTAWDLSANNREWAYVGAHYVVGSEFYSYLQEKYGLEQINDFVLKQSGFGTSSAYENIFGKSFKELFEDFQKQTRIEVAQSFDGLKSAGKVVFDSDLALIGALGMDPSGSIIFVGYSMDRTPQVFRVSSKGLLLDRSSYFDWFRPFVVRSSSPPLEWSHKSGQKLLYYFSSQQNSTGNSVVPGIYSYDLENGIRSLVRSLPMARSALVAGDGDTFYALVQSSPLEDVFVLERSSLSGKFQTEKLTVLKDFQAVSQLRLSVDSKSLSFSALKQAGTYGIYSISLRPDQKPELVLDSRGQDLFAQLSAEGSYFVSDLNGESFQIYKRVGSCVRQVSKEPFMVRSFLVSDSGSILAVSRRGQEDVLVEISDSDKAPCLGPESFKLESAVSREFPPSTLKAVHESTWGGLLPQTRVLLPRYSVGSGVNNSFGIQALFAGESPYKDWAWTVLGDVELNKPEEYAVRAGLGFRHFFPNQWSLNFESSPYAAGSSYIEDSRFLTSSLEWGRAFARHGFSAQLMHSRANPELQLGSAFAFSAAHSFSNLQQALRAIAPQRGWRIQTSADYFPYFFDDGQGGHDAIAVADSTQNVYIPILESLLPTHSVGLGFTEVFSANSSVQLVGSGGGASGAFGASSDLEQFSSGFRKASRGVVLRGYPTAGFVGTHAYKGTFSYAVPVPFFEGGTSSVFDRRWFNPESTKLGLTFFYDAAKISGLDAAVFGDTTSFLSSTGVQATWSLWMNESRASGLSATYVLAKELNFFKESSQTFDLSIRLSY